VRSDQGAQRLAQPGLVNVQGWRMHRIPLLSLCEVWNTAQYPGHRAQYYPLSVTKITSTSW